jgi:hypothetical protein
MTGNGGVNMIATISGMPTVIYEGNDAQSTYIPSQYFVKTKKVFKK